MDAIDTLIVARALKAVPAARAFHSANQIIATATIAILALDSERFDTDTIHDTVTNNSRLTCKTAGKYQITAQVRWDSSNTGTYRGVGIRLNGTTFIGFDLSPPPAQPLRQNVTTLYDLAVNDYVEVEVEHDSGVNRTIEVQGNYSPEFSMVRVA